jgi:hypothetical protein
MDSEGKGEKLLGVHRGTVFFTFLSEYHSYEMGMTTTYCLCESAG